MIGELSNVRDQGERVRAYVPIKLCLHEQQTGQIWPTGHGLPVPDLFSLLVLLFMELTHICGKSNMGTF